MQPSIAGVLVCCAILGMARFSEMPVVVALIASLAFGSTAIVTLPALGGSSPMIFVVFLAALVSIVALHRNILRELATVFRQLPTAWLILLLIVYTVVGAILLPRLFAGEMTVFVPHRDGAGGGGIAEVALYPVTGNMTQSLYFVLSALAFFALSVLLLKQTALGAVRKGFIALAILNVSMGLVDLFGKIAGLGDVLAPIRSASYAMLTEASAVGFWRITGGYAEASAFGMMSATLLAFTYTYWRSTRDRLALALSIALLILLILSTSSTAYVALGVLGTVLAVSFTRAVLRNRLQAEDLFLLACGLAVLCIALGVVLHNNEALDPLWHLFDRMVLDKSSSSSGQERAYWNYRSLETLYESAGLGIGIGSSRASSWIIAVLSQLGAIGSGIIGYLTLQIFRGFRLGRSSELDLETRATVRSVSAASIAALMAASISGSGADPGVIFFLTLAVVLRVQADVAKNRARHAEFRQGGHGFPAIVRG